MSIRPTIARTARRLVQNEPCVFCQFRLLQPIRRYAAPPRTWNVKINDKMAPQEKRFRMDSVSREAYFTLLKADKLLLMPASTCNQIVIDFMMNKKHHMEPAANIRQLAKKYKVDVVDIAYIAIPLFRAVTDDNKASVPPSQNPELSAAMLFACSAAKDVTSTLQILNAVYYSSTGNDLPQAREIARLFTGDEIDACMKMLEQLAAGGNTDAMTLQARFLEKSGNKVEARTLYERALDKCDTKFHPAYPHPLALPWLKPWTALATLLLADNSPDAIAKARQALEKGALKADDPVAYYQLASLEPGRTDKWLAYMSKAAASGIPEAMYQLGQFYKEVNAQPAAFLGNAKFRTALNFMTSWKRNGPMNYAKEWFGAAAISRHKPSLLELAGLCEAEGEKEKAKTYLRAVLEAPPKGKNEEWPHLVMQAQRRLAGL